VVKIHCFVTITYFIDVIETKNHKCQDTLLQHSKIISLQPPKMFPYNLSTTFLTPFYCVSDIFPKSVYHVPMHFHDIYSKVVSLSYRMSTFFQHLTTTLRFLFWHIFTTFLLSFWHLPNNVYHVTDTFPSNLCYLADSSLYHLYSSITIS